MAASRREKLEAMLKTDPNDVFLRYGLALEHAKEGRIDEAIAGLRTVTELDADYCAAYFQSGQLLAQLGRTQEAKDWLQRGIAAGTRSGNQHAAGEMAQFLASL